MHSGSEPSRKTTGLSHQGGQGHRGVEVHPSEAAHCGVGSSSTHLLHFSCSAPEEFNISLTKHALVPAKCSLCQLLTSKEGKGITSWSPIRMAYKEQPISSPSHWALWPQET